MILRLDAGMQVLYPTAAERQMLMGELTAGGATLEFQFRWPTELCSSSSNRDADKSKEETSEFDIRFERIILMLEVELGRLG